MANSLFNLAITTNLSAQAVKDKLILSRQSPVTILQALERLIGDYANGSFASSIEFLMNAVQATGTITFSSIANNDTVTVNGRVYTAKTSGASGAQQFNIGGSDANAATNLIAKINADTGSSLVYGVLKASSGGSGVVTITADTPGVAGNGITIAISAHGSVSGSGLLTSGSSDTPITVAHGI